MLYIQEEDPRALTRPRVRRFVHERCGEVLPSNLHVSVRRGVDLDDPVWVARLIEDLQRLDAKLLILDAARRFSVKTDEGPAKVRELIAVLRTIVTTAGVSVGEFDHTRAALEAMGTRMDFWKVRMRPGAPLGFGSVRGTPWIGLPGNPVSAMVTFELFVRPALRRMLGHTRLHRRAVTGSIDEQVSTGATLTLFLREIVTPRADGSLSARLTGPQGSGILTSMSLANALLVVPEDRSTVPAGERLSALLLTEDAGTAEEFAL